MELCLMASLGYPPAPAPGLVFHPSENSRLLKEHQIGLDQDPSRLCSFTPRPDHPKESLKSLIGRLDENKLLRSHLELRRPVHVDLQEFASYPIRFGSGIAEQCTKHDKTSRFIFPGSTEEEGHKMTLFELLKFVGPQVQRIVTMPQQLWAPYCEECLHDMEPQSLLLAPNSELCSTESLFVGDLNHGYHTHLPNGQLSFADYEMEIKDMLLSMSEEFSPSKSINTTTRAIVVPYFDRRIRKGVKANYADLSPKLEPAKSGEKVKNGTSSSRKKTNTKVLKEKEFYKNNNLHACESLLSLMFEKTRHDRTAILSLKKSGTEITNLLSQFSASIAGTGLAVILSVACKVACGRLPFCTSKFLSTGLGLGLVWLSWAVNQLRDTVITINKSSGKFGVGEEELMLSLDQRVRDIYFRVATLLAVVILRFA